MIDHRFFSLGALASLTLLAAACGDDPSRLTGGPQPGAGAGADDPASQAAALTCTDKPEGRSYTLFDGSKLEATRTNENVGVNRARIKPYAALAGEYQRVLGSVPPSLASAAGSFDDPPERWYAEAKHSGVSLDASFAIAFEGCQSYVAQAPEAASAPTAESATSFCKTLARKAWSRDPSPDEIASCVDLAVTKLAAEADPHRRLSYACASILSSSQFLTF